MKFCFKKEIFKKALDLMIRWSAGVPNAFVLLTKRGDVRDRRCFQNVGTLFSLSTLVR